MNSFKLLATLFMFNLSSFAFSENDEEYMIEVIVFEQLEIIGNEKIKDIQIFTTRPDTLFGCSFLALSVDNPVSKYYNQDNKQDNN